MRIQCTFDPNRFHPHLMHITPMRIQTGSIQTTSQDGLKWTEGQAGGWSYEQTRALVSVWSQANMQAELNGVTQNHVVFERIAREMGYEFTWKQCRTKIKILCRDIQR